MSRQEIFQQVVTILRDVCHIQRQEITQDLSLEGDLGLDSVGLFTLAVEIENHWELYLEEPPDHPPATIAELVALIEKRLQEKISQEDEEGQWRQERRE